MMLKEIRSLLLDPYPLRTIFTKLILLASRFTYFDDTIGSEIQLYNDYIGERLAIHEFNQTHLDVKLTIPYYLLAKRTDS
ncbi:MAG: hypothetical protein HONDAALG_04132 [Gammaproteobacteria bacterium]|nr:hypothetical protein [Gammaproteobacteria bacterium]